jgi:transcriptional regulator with XRE-family HTH domain
MDAARLARLRRMMASGEAKAIRKAARVSLRAAAGDAGLAPSTVCKWERGDTAPTFESSLAYLDTLDRLLAEVAS